MKEKYKIPCSKIIFDFFIFSIFKAGFENGIFKTVRLHMWHSVSKGPHLVVSRNGDIIEEK